MLVKREIRSSVQLDRKSSLTTTLINLYEAEHSEHAATTPIESRWADHERTSAELAP